MFMRRFTNPFFLFDNRDQKGLIIDAYPENIQNLRYLFILASCSHLKIV